MHRGMQRDSMLLLVLSLILGLRVLRSRWVSILFGINVANGYRQSTGATLSAKQSPLLYDFDKVHNHQHFSKTKTQTVLLPDPLSSPTREAISINNVLRISTSHRLAYTLPHLRTSPRTNDGWPRGRRRGGRGDGYVYGGG